MVASASDGGLCVFVTGSSPRGTGAAVTGKLVGSALSCGLELRISITATKPAESVETFTDSYSPARAGLIILIRTLALKWAPFGIRANAVAPVAVVTPTSPTCRPGVSEEDLSRDARRTRGRHACACARGAGGLAEAVAFLASPAAKYIKRQNLAVDGGLPITANLRLPMRYRADVFSEDGAIGRVDNGFSPELMELCHAVELQPVAASDIGAFVERVAINIGRLIATHHGNSPRSSSRAKTGRRACGRWRMCPCGLADGNHLRGTGHYGETYRKADGESKLASLQLTRLGVRRTDRSADLKRNLER
jgi:hypothetical protein